MIYFYNIYKYNLHNHKDCYFSFPDIAFVFNTTSFLLYNYPADLVEKQCPRWTLCTIQLQLL